MPGQPVFSSLEAERAELEAVAESLARSPRLARLVRYLGDKYFLGEGDQLHEYNIATDVFGRSKTAFDAGEDAIARVEAHRLRKKLKFYYETEGKDHAVKLWVPSGSYIPVFTHPEALDSSNSESESPQRQVQSEHLLPGQEGTPSMPTLGEKSRKKNLRFKPLVWPLLAAGLSIAALGFYLFIHFTAKAKNFDGAAIAAVSPYTLPSGGSDALGLPVRLIAGYTGKPQMDSAGALWGADRDFHGGGVWQRPAGFIARTSDPLLFEQWRTGDFFYDIPLKSGVYELHLYFVTSNSSNDAQASFSVGINDATVLHGFEINSDALGENIADERVFRDVTPNKDGVLHLSFTSERAAPALNAIEILPGTPHKQIPIRLVTQPTPFTDHSGNFWHPDNYFMNGRMSQQRQQIEGSPDPGLFGAERYGHFSYAIPVDTRDRYTVVLHFAEFYFGPHASGYGGVGSRLFRVMCNGTILLDDFDIYKEAGSFHALTKTFYHLKPSAQGKLNLTFEPIANNATVSGIEVLDESQ